MAYTVPDRQYLCSVARYQVKPQNLFVSIGHMDTTSSSHFQVSQGEHFTAEISGTSVESVIF